MNQTQAGMTLTEILITVLVVSVGMTAIAKLQTELMQAGAVAQTRIQALNQLQTELEKQAANQDASATGGRYEVPATPADYEVAWSVLPLNGVDDSYQYSISALWSDNRNRQQRVTLSTVFYADPLSGGDAASAAARGQAAGCIFWQCPAQGTPPALP